MSDRISVEGHSIDVQTWPGGKPPLLLLHEGLGSISLWREFPAQLAQATGRAVLAYSRFGHGNSDPPPLPHTTRFMHEEAERWLPSLLDAMAVDRAVLIGHSDGASIALIFSATYPARAAALILEAPHVFVEEVSIASIEATAARFELGDFRARLANYHHDVDLAFRGWSEVWLDPAFRAWNLEEYLPRVRVPVLVIQGEQDEYGTLRQVEAIASQVTAPVKTLILPNCGHAPHRDQPDTVIAAITQFVHGRGSRSTTEWTICPSDRIAASG